MGLNWLSIGYQVCVLSLGNVEAVGLGAKCSRCAHSTERRSTRLKTTKNVNAKTYTLGSSKISFKRINTASARREAVLA